MTLSRPQLHNRGRDRVTFHDHNYIIVVVEGVATFHDHKYEIVVVESLLSTTTHKSVVVESLRLDSYLHVLPPRFLSTTNVSFFVLNYGHEKPYF